MLELLPVSDPKHVEWLRIQRSRPELYKYFRQDAPLTKEHQAKWWRQLDKSMVRLFIICADGKWIGYAGFNPFIQRAGRAEFGIFTIPEHRGKGYGRMALKELLRRGFVDYNLRTVYSDCLDYPGEDRFKFYGEMGFEKYPQHSQGVRYMKQGKWVDSIRFFMTKDMWESNVKNVPFQLGPSKTNGNAAGQKDGRERHCIHPGQNRIGAAAQ